MKRKRSVVFVLVQGLRVVAVVEYLEACLTVIILLLYLRVGSKGWLDPFFLWEGGVGRGEEKVRGEQGQKGNWVMVGSMTSVNGERWKQDLSAQEGRDGALLRYRQKKLRRGGSGIEKAGRTTRKMNTYAALKMLSAAVQCGWMADDSGVDHRESEKLEQTRRMELFRRNRNENPM